MGDTETEKTRNPIPWICGLGAVWLSVGVARGCEDPRILEWFPGWGEKGKLRGIFVAELRHFQHFNRRHQRMSHKLQILQEFYLHISSVVDCPTFSTIYDVLNLYFWKLLFYHISFLFLFCHILEESLLFDYFQAAPCPGWAASAGRRDSPGFRCRRLNSLSMNTITQKLSQNDNFSPQVEELEKSLSRAVGASQQKQQQLDSLNQGLEKIKRKVSKVFCICRLSKGLI